MRYPDPTGQQLLIVVVAMILPLVWAFTRHGRARMFILMFWLPSWLFVARVVYMNLFPTAPLEARLRVALLDLLSDPLTVVWPLFVLLIYGLIWLFTIPRRRHNANAQATSIRATPNVSVGFRAQSAAPTQTLPPLWRDEKPSEPEPLKRCLGCNRRIPISATSCPHCRYSFGSPRSPEKSALPTAGPYTLPPEKRKTCPKCDMIVASWANHCPACQHSFVEVRSPGSVAEPSRPPDAPTPSGNTKPLIAVVEQIRLLGELRNEGLLTEDEFQAKKTELLSRI